MEETYSCEQDGSCDDSCSPPARGDCLAETTASPDPVDLPVQQDLPHTGGGAMIVAAILLVAASRVTKR